LSRHADQSARIRFKAAHSAALRKDELGSAPAAVLIAAKHAKDGAPASRSLSAALAVSMLVMVRKG
jgi:hypothetical protein